MKESTNKKTTKKTMQKTESKSVKSHKNHKSSQVDGTQVLALENSDVKNAVLTTSLLINLFFLTAWVAIRVSTDYAHTIGAAIFNI